MPFYLRTTIGAALAGGLAGHAKHVQAFGWVEAGDVTVLSVLGAGYGIVQQILDNTLPTRRPGCRRTAVADRGWQRRDDDLYRLFWR